MPWGLMRFHHSGQSHFVTFCCYHRPVQKEQTSAAESRIRFGCLTARVELVPFPICGRKPTNLRVSLGARAAEFQASGLRVCSHAGACSPAAQRTTAGYSDGYAEELVSRRWRQLRLKGSFDCTSATLCLPMLRSGRQHNIV